MDTKLYEKTAMYVSDVGLSAGASYLAEKLHMYDYTKTGKPYYTGHILPIAAAVKNVVLDDPSIFDSALCAAFLHDILEDHYEEVSYVDIAKLFNSEIADAVYALTRQYEESYNDYCKRASENKIAKIVKKADLEHNLNIKDFMKLEKDDIARINKYLKAYHRYFD